uniref:Ig-like domain-containing protein n=1 Tax=Pseudomonas graminis TaxID=158627 RepID=A0A7C1WTD7_9PSED
MNDKEESLAGFSTAAAGNADSVSTALVNTVELYDGERRLGAADVVDGQWRYEYHEMPPGGHQITARVGQLRSDAWTFQGPAAPWEAPWLPEVFLDSGTGLGNSLNLVKPLESATVIVSYPEIIAGDSVTMHWSVDALGSTSQTLTADDSGSVKFSVPASTLTASTDHVVEVTYSVRQSGVEVVSPGLTFTVTNTAYYGRSKLAAGLPAYYECDYAPGELAVFATTAPGTVLFITPDARPSGQATIDFDGTASAYVINEMAAQPIMQSTLFPTAVGGIGMKLTFDRKYLSAGREATSSATTMYLPGGGLPMTIELVVTGAVTSGVIPAGELFKLMYCAERLQFVSVRWARDLKIVAL